MKKISILAVSLAVTVAASAQMNVIKDAQRSMKGGEAAEKVVNAIKPAMSNPETAKLADTYYIPGKASYNEYDKLLGLKQFGKTKESDDVKMGKLLIAGYDYFMQALPLDTVTDAKGKVKTKYSKDIIGTLAGHFADYTGAGADLYNGKDFEGAYKAWEIFNTLPTIPAVREKINNMPSDTIFGEIGFNQALAAWQADNMANALKSFMYAKSKGYNKKTLYDYAISVATNLNDSTAVLALAKEALPIYGNEDPMYMGQIVNYYLQAKEYDNAFGAIKEAIASDPANSQYYVIEGVLYENTEKLPEAVASYRKAVELNAENAQALGNLGKALCMQAYKLDEEAPASQAEYTTFKDAKILPLFQEAAGYLEKSYSIDQDVPDVLTYLENIYYNLNDEAKLNDVKKRKAYN